MSGSERNQGKEGEASVPSVHSANKWESAKFEDNAQRQKFLRLMGGMKKTHTGRFVIGDTHEDAHARTDAENKQMTETLEHQYQSGLEKKLTGQSRRHVGLGFSEPEEEAANEPAGSHIRFSDGEEEEGSGGDGADKPSKEKDGKDPDKRDQDGSRKGKEEGRRDRDEKRRDERGRDDRRRSSRDEEGGSRERYGDKARDNKSQRRDREDDRKHRDRKERDRESRPKDSRHSDGKHRYREESDETTDQMRKKHKQSKRDDNDSASGS